MMRPGEAMVG